jgi:hypothetical protein
MANKKKKIWFSDGADGAKCPNCGHAMKAVEYYSARPVQREVVQQLSTQQIITTYQDVTRHIGNICLFCAHDNEKGKRTAGLALLVTGAAGSALAMLAGLIRARVAEVNGGNVGAAMTPAMFLMILLLIIGIIGLAIFLEGNAFRNNRVYDQDKLFPLFIKKMYQESNQSGLVYLSPWQAAQLKKK